jgi:O-antigen ligase
MKYWKYLLGFVASLLGVIAVFAAGIKSFYISFVLFVPVLISLFLKNFEISVLGLLIIRSSLDPLSDKGLTGLYALGLSGLAISYVAYRLLFKQVVQVDSFWCFFAGWVALQGLWVVLLPLGGLGFDGEHVSEAVREWLRILSWLMAYLLTLQLKDRVSPEKFVSYMMLALIVPVGTAFLQLSVPGHLLPTFLAVNQNQDGFRINGTLGVSNTFSTFLVLFIGLAYWKIVNVQKRLPWIGLLIALVFLLVNTKTLVGIAMLVVLMTIIVLPRLSVANLFGVILLLALVGILFMSTDFGRARLASISETPLLNPDIDVSRAVLLSAGDSNSFNWRVAQWTALMGHWQFFPLFGYGLQTTNLLGPMFAWAHNDYVRVLVEEGVVGFTLFLSFWGVQFARLLKLITSPFVQNSQKSFCTVLAAFLLATMIGMLTENVWSHTALFIYWFPLSAIANWHWQKSEHGERTTKAKPRLAHFSP